MTIIGYGTYGCIYKPPIKCSKKGKTLRINYANKIAKLLTQKSANTEYAEYDKVSKIDPKNKYHLGKPVLCEADAEDLKKQTDEHPCNKYEKERDNQEFRLLIMEYGGTELKEYIKNKKDMTMDFWKKARNLLEGAQLFAKHNLTHRDIKPSNILLNPKSKRLIYIDFGLTHDMTELKNKILDGTKKTKFHWIYPFEYGLVQNSINIISMSPPDADAFYQKTANLILHDSLTDEYKNVEKIFTMMDDRIFPLNQAKKESMIYDSIDAIRQFANAEQFIEAMVKSIDAFSLGLTLNETLNAFYDAGKIDDIFYKEMHAIFARMTDFNLKERLTDYKTIIELYDKAMKIGNSKRIIRTRKNLAHDGFTPVRV